MKADETFPLPWEQLIWSTTPVFPVSLLRPATRYALTDFRLMVRRNNRTLGELALDDIDKVRLTQAWWQRAIGTSTVRVHGRRGGAALELANVHQGPELALVLQLRATEAFGEDGRELGADFLRSALRADAAPVLRRRSNPFVGMFVLFAFAVLFSMFGLAVKSSLPPVAYAADDAIAPNGSRRSAEDIAAFMEREVMPFARQALGPLVGGPDQVTCETCHGQDGQARAWRMPGVRALPAPDLRLAGLERAKSWLDPQMRNAVYGYLAEADNQSIASYMRQVVMPGMAKVMHRPAYDFARSYGYNRARAAIGCYHCHLVE